MPRHLYPFIVKGFEILFVIRIDVHLKQCYG
jgi:hypothetical protein